jgi:transposase
LDRIVSQTDHLLLVVQPIQALVRCPQCTNVSSHLHSRYERLLADLPWEGTAVQQFAQRFARFVRERKAQEFAPWLEAAVKSSSPEIKGFVAGLKRDQAAVEGALTYAWSNGQTEGQVNKLKNLKRQMFGRSKFDLLKARVLASPERMRLRLDQRALQLGLIKS